MRIRNILASALTFCILCGFTYKQEEQVNTEYKIISKDVPNFDTTPIRYENYGFFYKEKDSYGFIDSENSVLIPSGKYQTLSYIPVNEVKACLYEQKGRLPGPGDNISVDYELGLTDTNVCNGGIGGTWPDEWIGEDDIIYRYNLNEKAAEEITSSEYSMILPRSSGRDGSDLDWSVYYIVSQDLKTVYGPYSSSETPSFTVLSSNQIKTNHPYYDSICLYYGNYMHYNFGMFYERTEDGYVIHSSDGMKKTEKIYDNAEPVSDYAIKVERDGLMGIVDSSLNEVYMGDFEDCTELIHGRGYIKKDGEWMYVQFDVTDIPIKAESYTAGTYICDTNVPLEYRMFPSADAKNLEAGQTIKIEVVKSGLFNSVWGKTEDFKWVCIEDENGVYLHKK